VRPTRPADEPQSFIKALHEKYASEALEEETKPQVQIVISGTKVAQEMGFDKIRRKLAQVKELKIVILDGMRINTPTSGEDASIVETCPSIKQLDMSMNLFESLDTVETICGELPALRVLRLRYVAIRVGGDFG
jgi:tubulin-specific chaperone E